jgi:hypothetical protein
MMSQIKLPYPCFVNSFTPEKQVWYHTGMKRLRLKRSEAGFIPLLLTILAIVVIGIIFVYLRVLHAQN